MSDIKLACTVVEQVKSLCDQHGNDPGELINILHEAQHLHGYLPEEMQRIIAHKLNIPVSKVYGVVTFYTFFTMTPKGKHPISVCMGTACYVRGSEKLLEISGITLKNGRNDAKRLNISAVTVSNDAKPKIPKKQRKAELSRRTVCKSLPDGR